MLTALITGTSTGIGRATALELARSGLTVWASMRDTSMGASLESVASSENLDLRVLQLDVEDDDSVNTAFQKAGDIDVLINSALFFISFSSIKMPLFVVLAFMSISTYEL